MKRTYNLIVSLVVIVTLITTIISLFLLAEHYTNYLNASDYFSRMARVSIFCWIALVALLFAIYVAQYVHETGHKYIYKKAGIKSTIESVPVWYIFIIFFKPKERYRWITRPESQELEDELRRNNPKMYLYLCLSGVSFATIASIPLTLLALMVSGYHNRIVGTVLTFVALYNFLSLTSYRLNVFSKLKDSDGFKARAIINDTINQNT